MWFLFNRILITNVKIVNFGPDLALSPILKPAWDFSYKNRSFVPHSNFFLFLNEKVLRWCVKWYGICVQREHRNLTECSLVFEDDVIFNSPSGEMHVCYPMRFCFALLYYTKKA